MDFESRSKTRGERNERNHGGAGRRFLGPRHSLLYSLSSLTCGIVPQMACEYYVLSGGRRVGAFFVLRSQAGLWEGKVTIRSWKIPDEYWKFSGFTRFRLPGISRDAPNLRRLFTARRILRMPTPRRQDNTVESCIGRIRSRDVAFDVVRHPLALENITMDIKWRKKLIFK